MQQTKEQGKNPQDQTNEETGSLPKKEFRAMIVKMIQNLGNRMEKIQETFNKDLEELKSKQFFVVLKKKKYIYIYIYIYLFIYLFWLHWVFVSAQAFSSCSEWGLLFVAGHELLIAVASLVAEHWL